MDNSRDNVLELIKMAFEKKPAQLRDADGITYVWLLEQMLSVSVETDCERGWEFVLKHSIDLLSSFGGGHSPRVPDLLGERERRCMKILPQCLQAMRDQYTSPVNLCVFNVGAMNSLANLVLKGENSRISGQTCAVFVTIRNRNLRLL